MNKRMLASAIVLAGLLCAQTVPFAAAEYDIAGNDIQWGSSAPQDQKKITNVLSHNLEMRAEQDEKTTPELLKQCSFALTQDTLPIVNMTVYNVLDQGLGYMDVGLWIDSQAKKSVSEQVAVMEELQQITQDVIRDCKTDYEKCRALHDWVCANIWYDMDVFAGKKSSSHTIAEVLKTRTGVCADYTQLYNAMLRIAGIPAKEVDGFALGVGESSTWNSTSLEKASKQTNHAWTEAYVDGEWIIIDTTWDSQNRYQSGQYGAKKPVQSKYFDCSDQTFAKDHCIRQYNLPDVPVLDNLDGDLTWEATADSVTTLKTIDVDGKQFNANGQAICCKDEGRFAHRVFFKLRDVANAMSGTDKQFEIVWDKTKQAINLIPNKAYTPVGTENAKVESVDYTAVRNTKPLLVNGKTVDWVTYTVNGDTYVRLGDLAKALDFCIGGDEKTAGMFIDTTKGYPTL